MKWLSNLVSIVAFVGVVLGVMLCCLPLLFSTADAAAEKQYHDSEGCLSEINMPEPCGINGCPYGFETLSTCGLDDEPRFYPVGALAPTGSYVLDLLIRNARELGLTLLVLDTLETDPITAEINADDDFYGHPQLSRWEGFVDRDGPRPVRQWTRGHTARVTKFSTNGDVISDEAFDVKTLAELKARIWGMP